MTRSPDGETGHDVSTRRSIATSARRRTAAAMAALAPGTVDVRLLTMTPRLDGLAGRAPTQPGPPGRRARRLPGPAPARRDHERPAAHTCPRVVRRRRRVQDAVQHRLRGPPRHGSRRAGRSPLPRRHASRPLPALARGDHRRATRQRPGGRSTGCNPTRPRRSPATAPRSRWWRASRWPTRCPATPGGRPRVTAAASPRCSSTPPAPWPRWPLMRGTSISPAGVWSRRGSSSPTARRSRGPPWRWRRPKATRTASDAEWRECQRRVDALDPGCSPSARTESLYGELSRRVLVGAVPAGNSVRTPTATSD